MANKVKYNLKNVHYAVATSSGYSTPVAVSGAVNLTLDAQGDDYVFYADGIRYFEYHTNNGYSGTLEMAIIPESFKTDVLGEVSSNGKIFELDDVQIKNFALGFEIDGDEKGNLFWFYNCSASRPSVSGQTKEESVTVNTETLNITNAPDPRITISGKHPVKVRNANTSSTSSTQWFTAVYTS